MAAMTMGTPEQNDSDLPAWGPSMAALNERQRAFVIALYSDECPEEGDGQLIWCAERANYGNKDGTSTNKTLSVIASRLIQDPAIKAAIMEYGNGAYCAILPRKVRAIKHVLRTKNHRDFGRVAMAGVDRLAPIEATHTLRVEHINEPVTPEALDRVLRRIDDLARRAGLLPVPVIDAEVVEVTP
jgi:hypothetical protein